MNWAARCTSWRTTGTLEGVHDHPDFALGHFRPIGDTDSEHAFCNLLARMEGLWLSGGSAPQLDQRLAVFAAFAEQARTLGSANFLYADGDYLFVQANQRYQEDGSTRPPGLHILNRRCRAPQETVSGGGVSVTSDIQAVTLLASVPLTDEDWQPLPKNTILAPFPGGGRGEGLTRSSNCAGSMNFGLCMIQETPCSSAVLSHHKRLLADALGVRGRC